VLATARLLRATFHHLATLSPAISST
jgi:hypothetical protein